MTIRIALLCMLLAGAACVDNGADEMILELSFAGDGGGRVDVLINPVDGDEADQQVVECTESCEVSVEGDALVQLVATASPGSNFLSWNRNTVGRTCRGTGVCEFFVYDDFELEVDFSSTQAALEVEHTVPTNLPITFAGPSVVHEGLDGDGQCNADKCVIIADVGTELRIGAPAGGDRVRWAEIGRCGASGVICVVPYADGPTTSVVLDANKWRVGR